MLRPTGLRRHDQLQGCQGSTNSGATLPGPNDIMRALVVRKFYVRSFLLTLTLGFGCAFVPVIWAADDGRVAGWGSCGVQGPISATRLPDFGSEELDILSGRVEFEVEGDAEFSQDIVLRSGERSLRARGASYDQSKDVFTVNGEVEFSDPLTTVKAQSARFDRKNSQVDFSNAEFSVATVPARGWADEIQVTGLGAGKVYLNDVSYTACPEGNEDWVLEAGEIFINQDTGIGTAKDAKFRISGIPVLYVPYISYPVTNERKTGWLIPDLGNSQQRGADIGLPWYWNISPNLDATITPRLMTKRGLQMGGEFRYLTERHDGALTGEYLYDDDATNKNRALLAVYHRSKLLRNLRGTIDAISVSDAQYFEDFSSNLATTSQTHLPQGLDLEFFNGPWTAQLSIEDYQTIDDTLLPEQRPYTRLPELTIQGFQPQGLFGLTYGLNSALSYFDRDVGVQGLRAHIMPELTRPFRWGIVDIEPGLAYDYLRYKLRDTAANQDKSPTRNAPLASLDIRSTFERISKNSQWLQTIEPRVLYNYVPFRDQSALPIFDTIEPDLNIVQLFRRNRFIGLDRLGDTNQIALGVTTRFIRADSGQERARATLGQVRYFRSQRVTLPGVLPNESSSSDYLAEIGGRIGEHWRTDMGYQWNSEQSETRQAEIRVQYRNDERIANLSYRFQRDTLETIDLAVAWPLAKRWNFVGRYNFSLERNDPLERFAGIEYETCCWAARGVWRRYLTRRTGESDTSFLIQFVLKGFSDPGSAAEDLLGRGILEYR